MPREYILSIVAVLLFLTGCQSQVQKPIRVCPGAESVLDSLSSLRLRSQNTVPLKANGRCRLIYYAEGKKHRENFPVKLWVNPPSEICLQGDVVFDPKGIVLGSNRDEFWLAMKPKEISSYWWGWWSERGCLEKVMISPKTILEALGIAEVVGEQDSEQRWFLSNEGAFDVLTKRDGDTEAKKIYIYSCNYRIRKIEYFNVDGQAAIITELGKYKEVSGGFFVPTLIKIVNRAGQTIEDSVSITISLKSIKSTNFTDKQRRHLFTRPEPHGFKHVYKIVDGNVIEQAQ